MKLPPEPAKVKASDPKPTGLSLAGKETSLELVGANENAPLGVTPNVKAPPGATTGAEFSFTGGALVPNVKAPAVDTADGLGLPKEKAHVVPVDGVAGAVGVLTGAALT